MAVALLNGSSLGSVRPNQLARRPDESPQRRRSFQPGLTATSGPVLASSGRLNERVQNTLAGRSAFQTAHVFDFKIWL